MSAQIKNKASQLTFRCRKDVKKILDQEIKCIPSDEYRRRNAENQLFGDLYIPESLPTVEWYTPTLEKEVDRDVKKVEVMTPAQEVIAFKRYNFCRWKLIQLQKTARENKKNGKPTRFYPEVIQWHRRTQHLREYLFRTNLGLILYLLKKKGAYLQGQDLSEVISASEDTLLRCIDKFNVARGFKFSTYACRAIIKEFSRLVQKSQRKNRFEGVSFDPEISDAHVYQESKDTNNKDFCVEVLQKIIKENTAELTETEKTVLNLRHNLDRTQKEGSYMTLDQVGDQTGGLSKERIRQIQRKAQQKIRAVLEIMLRGPQEEEEEKEEV